MKIKAGNYVTISSDEELLIAIALFTEGGFDFVNDKIILGDSWKMHKPPLGIPSCLAAAKNGECYCTLVEELKERNDKAVEIFLPSAKSILESLD